MAGAGMASFPITVLFGPSFTVTEIMIELLVTSQSMTSLLMANRGKGDVLYDRLSLLHHQASQLK